MAEPRDDAPGDLTSRLREAAALLDAVAADRALLAALPDEERQRFITAAGDVFCPDVSARRKLAKAMVRRRHAATAERDQAVLAGTGIRQLRQKPVFTTPNVLPPAGFTQHEVKDDPAFRDVVEPRNCSNKFNLPVSTNCSIDRSSALA